MSNNSTIFTGSSRYSTDLQQVLTRSIAIASLPLTQLNSQLTDLQNRSAALDSLNGKFAALQTALQAVSAAAASTSAQVSDDTVLAPHSDSTALPGSYAIHVVSAGAPTSAVTKSSLPVVQDPSTQSITSASSLTLTVGGTTFTVTPSGNTLNALADAINASGANVTATIINLGSPAAPDYKLSLQSSKLGNIALQLNDGTQNLLTTLATGSQAQYQVNGQPTTPISSDSSTVTIAPGLTVDLLKSGDSNVVVSRSGSAQSNALSSFVAAYNAAVDELNLSRGQGGGPLVGDPVIYTLSQSLRSLTQFTGGGAGSVQNLTDLGLTFDKTGKLSFDQTVFDSVSAAHSSDVRAFLGSASTGGFLKAATDTLNGLEDPINGTIQTTRDSAQTAIDNQNKRIADEQSRIDILQKNLTGRMAAADALIASLEQQVSYFTTLFASMNATQNK
ncbi:MAG: flagellar hook-associated 2 domain protein [Bryobacterales bacterium]|nr:flagellar hook-associated 2 domain protein [Bryobacterales bacterium]